MSTWRTFFNVSVISAVCLIFAGCTNSCSQKVSDTDSTMNVVLSANVKGLDPIYANDVYSNSIVNNISETLMEYHYLKRPLELKPLLAEGMPEVSADGLTHTFKIKKGVKFHNNEAFENGIGRELKASDFEYSWKRLADPRLQADGFWIFDGKIAGLNEWRDKVSAGEADYDTPVEGITATDDHTLVVKLSKPYFQLHYVLTMSYTSPVAKEVVEKYGKEYLNHPVGTGPYKFSNWVRNNKIELVKNENWHGQTYPTEGAPGDEVSLTISRPGGSKEKTVRLVREEVHIPNVPYSGLIDDETGYIYLTTFSEKAGKNVADALENEMIGLKGHRSVGGLRASIYNAMPEAGVQALVDFMAQFEKQHEEVPIFSVL